MINFKSNIENLPFGYYIFNIIGNNKPYKDTNYFKLGFTKNQDVRDKEWDKDLIDHMKKYGNITDWRKETVCRIDGVYPYKDGTYTLIGQYNLYINNSDSLIRQYFFENDYTTTRDYKIRLYADKGIDEVFSVEGLNFIDRNISYDEIIKIVGEFVEGVKNRTINKKFYHVLNKTEYDKYVKDLVNNKSYVSYNTKDFFNYMVVNYGNIMSLEFIEILERNRYELGLLKLEDNILNTLKIDIPSNFGKEILRIYTEIHKHPQSNIIIEKINNWLNLEIKEYESSLF